MKPEWLVRAEEEQAQLWARICGLDMALNKSSFVLSLPEEELQDLREQRDAMVKYNASLSRRIKRNHGMISDKAPLTKAVG